MLTGQLSFRDAGPAPTKDGRRLYMVFGLVAVSPGQEFRDGYLYPVTDRLDLVVPDELVLRASLSEGEDHLMDLKGTTPSGALMLPIWRC